MIIESSFHIFTKGFIQPYFYECILLSDRSCRENEFRCDSGHCIPVTWVCDNETDCKEDGSDESPSVCSKSINFTIKSFEGTLNISCLYLFELLFS